MKRRALVIAPIVVVVLVVVAIVVLKEDPPVDCSVRRDEVAALTKTGLALTSTRKLGALATRVDEHLAEQNQRPSFLRRYDTALCRDGAQALVDARAAVAHAERTKAQAETIATGAGRRLLDAQESVNSSNAWVAAGVVPADVVARLTAARAKLTETEAALRRAKSELSALGYEGGLEGLERADAQVTTTAEDASRLAREANGEGLRGCTPKVKGQPLKILDARAFKDWLVVRGADGTAFFALEGEPRRCIPVASVPRTAGAKTSQPGTLDNEQLVEWFVPGVIDAKLLVGWGRTEAWFVTRDGAFRAFRHLANVGAGLGGDGCGKPRIALGEIEASCAAFPRGSDVSRTMTVRYAWDGHAVIAEQ